MCSLDTKRVLELKLNKDTFISTIETTPEFIWEHFE